MNKVFPFQRACHEIGEFFRRAGEDRALIGFAGQAVFAGLPFDIADRTPKRARKDLADWPEDALAVRELPADQGPGVILMLEARYANVTELVSGIGQLGVTAESLAKTAVARVKGYIESTAFAGPYLADQLILPFALAGGGAFTCVKPSQHMLTAIDIVRKFTGRRIEIARRPRGEHLVTFG